MEQNQYELKVDLPNATVILVLGIISIPACCISSFIPVPFLNISGILFAIPALILASSATKLYVANPDQYTEGSFKNIKAGKICAWVGLIPSLLSVICTIGIIIYFGFGALTDPTIIFEQLGIEVPAMYQ
ncbi:hypothetical protein FACS189426_11970 [Bacteroidia bacterium]|nr:hypothetical protein FACS189426_11970 [Bacteroidia bacterium]GHV70363.1 hypothetical protein FACS189420_1150 [Bacteroidia bacterium]